MERVEHWRYGTDYNILLNKVIYIQRSYYDVIRVIPLILYLIEDCDFSNHTEKLSLPLRIRNATPCQM